MPPINDNFVDAIILTSSGTVPGTNVDATAEGADPAALWGGATVWYRWTAPRDMTAGFSLVSHPDDPWPGTDPTALYDTLLGVYTGTSLGALSLVAANDDAVNYESEVTFAATAGTVYSIGVDGYGGATGTFTLRWGERSFVVPEVSVVGSSTLRWSGPGEWGGTIAVPTGTAEGDLLVVMALHVPAWGPSVVSTDKFISGSWTLAQLDGGGVLHGYHTVAPGDPEEYEVNFAPHGDWDPAVDNVIYDQDGPAGNCVMLALRGVDTFGRFDRAPQFLSYGSTPSPFQAFILDHQHGSPGSGIYDPDAVVSLASSGPLAYPIIISAFTLTGVVGFWAQDGAGPTDRHWEYRTQTGPWTTPVDESGVLTFTELSDFDSGPTMAVAVALNVPAVPGPVGNIRSTPSDWDYCSYTVLGDEFFLGVEVWGDLFVAGYPALEMGWIDDPALGCPPRGSAAARTATCRVRTF